MIVRRDACYVMKGSSLIRLALNRVASLPITVARPAPFQFLTVTRGKGVGPSNRVNKGKN